ncbi:helix-turn-helix domain-containing protein [Rouxiella badensis]|uniref:helix-turn-helix domain-containing protein n=1 Tax=Rouxiella badensis TaxID=1646377 RepID=UPI001787DA53|nr:helix-turn-helix domain-containing protein [Rouxiella badensis]QOI58022.1 helix-turn-helix domain-containing protein [Rouxiella badensis subsp. acadiensis]
MYTIRPDNYFRQDSQPVAVHRTLPEINETEHNHEFEELVIVERGSGIHVMNGEAHFIQSGDVFYVNNRDFHYYRNAGSLGLTNILIRPEVNFLIIPSVESILHSAFPACEKSHLRLGIKEREIFFNLLNTLDAQLVGKCKTDALMREGLLLQMLSLFTHVDNVLISEEHVLAIERILEDVRRNHCEDINWVLLCSQHGISRRTLFRQVKNVTGYTPERYVITLRLRTAREMIRNEDLSITAVAAQCGFKNFSHFSRCYKKLYKVSPSDER